MGNVKVWEAVEVYGDEIGRLNLTERDTLCIVREGDVVPLGGVGLQGAEEIVLLHKSPAAVVAATSRRSHADTSAFDLIKTFFALPFTTVKDWYRWAWPSSPNQQPSSPNDAALIDRYWNPPQSTIEIKLE